MDTVLRAMAVYFSLLVLLRLAGGRTLGEMTTFDFVLVLIISESVSEGLVGDDGSLTGALLLVVTLVLTDVGVSVLKQRRPSVERILDGVPMLLVVDGVVRRDRLANERVDEGDILAAARESHGLERFDQIKHAVLEKDGSISIVPRA